jgi:hypothetical protein
MKSNVKMTIQTKSMDRSGMTPSVPRLLDEFIPERTEVMLKPSMGMAYVKLGKCLHNPPIVGMKGLARDVDQGGK